MRAPNLDLANTRRIIELDGLRGIAILLVISFHYINNQLINSTYFWGIVLAKITSFGWVGVDLFFVLSGYLIGSILYKTKNSLNYFSTFYLRRCVRIIPNYYLLLLVFIFILSSKQFINNHFLTGNNVIPIWSYFFMVHNIFMANMDSLGNDSMSVTWSIGIEEQFYLIFPFIVYYFKTHWLPILLLCLIILAVYFRINSQSWIPPYVLLPCRMDAISFGALVAWCNYYQDLYSFAQKYKGILFLVLGFLIVICGYLYFTFNDLGPIRNSLFALIFSIGLIAALTYKSSWYCTFLRNKVLVWIGTISYSLYLFHYLILGIFKHFETKGAGIGISSFQDVLVTTGAFLFSLFFSWIIYLKLETPMVQLGKKFKY